MKREESRNGENLMQVLPRLSQKLRKFTNYLSYKSTSIDGKYVNTYHSVQLSHLVRTRNLVM